MESLIRYVAPPSPCGYLPDQIWSLEYELVTSMSAAEYGQRMAGGWRRFGRALFRPRCQACQACQPLRVLADAFRPDRSMRRVIKANTGITELRIHSPSVSRAKLSLYDSYHAFQAQAKGWPQHPAKDPQSYTSSFVDNPFATQEWCYYLGPKLVGVGYVDDVPCGLSAVYFFYDVQYRHLSLGTWNVLNVLSAAAKKPVPHLYLGYYVAGCGSMAYKARFRPSQVLGPDGRWRDFETA
jgi:arginyl-tRNA--protein-N-Asp/Glu arginylyltransferase